MRVALLSGGTGGAKLAHGFQQVVPGGSLDVIVNVGDDLELFGLHVSPDLDSVLYTLAGLVDRDRGWGVAGDTDRALTMLERYGEETWFWLGDADLGTLVRRTAQLRRGASLTRVTADMAAALGVPSRILPATDGRLRTRILTDDGDLEFQRYFVERGQRDEVRGISFEGAASAPPTDEVLDAVSRADLVVIGPSNPLVSIEPILAMPGMREALAAAPGRRSGGQPHRGWEGAQGAYRSDDELARSRGERGRGRPPVRRTGPGVGARRVRCRTDRCRHRRRLPGGRAADRDADR